MSEPTASVPQSAQAGPNDDSRLAIAGVEVLFGIALRRDLLARKTFVFALLFALPMVLAWLVRYFGDLDDFGDAERAFVFWLIPQALLPLAALLYATGMVQDEVEEQTLTYLLVRPITRWAIYATKLAAALSLMIVLTALFTVATYVVLYAGHGGLGHKLIEASQTAVLLSMALSVYAALFGLLGLVFRRALVLGVVYLVLFEGIFANVDFVVRRLTVIYYFRVLAMRWLELPDDMGWQVDLLGAPQSGTCLAVLIGACAVLTATGAMVFAGREFRMKTPDGS